jgi:hypothetical protein
MTGLSSLVSGPNTVRTKRDGLICMGAAGSASGVFTGVLPRFCA